MADVIKLLASGSPAALLIGAAALIVGVAASTLYIVAFVQGRSISFWPPSIGARPTPPTTNGVARDLAIRADIPPNPVVDRGTVVRAASGASYTIASPFYGGANATLYKASDPVGRAVIVKVYWRGLAPNSPAWELFQHEQRASEGLNHRNIVKTLDRGLRAGYPFTVFDLLAGGTLRDWLRTHDRVPGDDIVSIAGQVADAIDYAHSQGVVHRDVKPGNILFESDPRGRVALSDFGVASMLGAVERDITASGGEFAGSAGYLAPESISGRAPTQAVDVYSFGVVVYEMISKSMPFDERGDVLAIIRAKVDQDAPDIRRFRPDVPEAIARRLASTLAREPGGRPPTARAVLAGIEDGIRKL
ncbi:MAG TPA: serine/threonine-protein kinase [Vicinamibacterales bacterium]|nr:serine/threonine-protein kinase [Vicinamibacterales bacterium]